MGPARPLEPSERQKPRILLGRRPQLESGQTDLIDQSGAEKTSVGYAAAIDLKTLDAELAIQDLLGQPEIEFERQKRRREPF